MIYKRKQNVHFKVHIHKLTLITQIHLLFIVKENTFAENIHAKLS